MSNWVDFKKLRESLDVADVLNHYGIEYKRKGTQAQAVCPLPNHQGNRKSPSFSVSFEKRIFQCFGCSAKGNLLDLIALLEGLDPADPGQFRQAALLAQERFGAGSGERPMKRQVPQHDPRRNSVPPAKVSTAKELPVLVNAPLDFALKNLSSDHAYFRKRGVLPETIEHFGLGYCTKGMFAGRIAIPLQNAEGQLIGYAGKLSDEFEVTQEQPEYLWPTGREHNGVKHVFDRGNILYHSHTIEREATDLIVVQDAPSAWWVWQAGFPYVVGLMGVTPSPSQSSQIVDLVRKTGRIWILTNGNKTGDACAHDLFEDVGSKRFCRWLRLSEGLPTNQTPEDLATMLEWKIPAR